KALSAANTAASAGSGVGSATSNSSDETSDSTTVNENTEVEVDFMQVRRDVLMRMKRTEEYTREDVQEVIDTLSGDEKACLDQWYLWTPGRWVSGTAIGHRVFMNGQGKVIPPGRGSRGGKMVPGVQRMKAWEVALLGAVLDWWEDEEKWKVAAVILSGSVVGHGYHGKVANGEEVEEEGSDGEFEFSEEEEDEEDDDDDDESYGVSRRSGRLASKQQHAIDSTRHDTSKTRNARGGVNGVSTENGSGETKKQVKSKKGTLPEQMTKSEVMQFIKSTESGVRGLSVTDRIRLMKFLVEECVSESDIVRERIDHCFETVGELQKEKQVLWKEKRQIHSEKTDLDKKLKAAGIDLKMIEGGAEQNGDEVLENDDVDESMDVDDDGDVYGSRKRKSKRPTKKKQLDEETQKALIEQRLEVGKKYLEITINETIINQKIDMYTAGYRLEPLGQDRFGNIYWWYDDLFGPYMPSHEEYLEYGEEGIKEIVEERYDIEAGTGLVPVASGKLFVEVAEGGRKRWGYYDTVGKLDQLTSWLDNKGPEEKNLVESLQLHGWKIATAMLRKQGKESGCYRACCYYPGIDADSEMDEDEHIGDEQDVEEEEDAWRSLKKPTQINQSRNLKLGIAPVTTIPNPTSSTDTKKMSAFTFTVSDTRLSHGNLIDGASKIMGKFAKSDGKYFDIQTGTSVGGGKRVTFFCMADFLQRFGVQPDTIKYLIGMAISEEYYPANAKSTEKESNPNETIERLDYAYVNKNHSFPKILQ
ncbi:hypothetical protein HK098_004279, partial [Nowakowskiella sp. JEL0407]